MSEQTTSDGPRAGALHSIFIRCAAIMALTTIVVAGVLSGGAMQLLERMAVADVNLQGERAADKAAEDLAKPLRFNVTDKIEEAVAHAFSSVGASGGAAVVVRRSSDRELTARVHVYARHLPSDLVGLDELATHPLTLNGGNQHRQHLPHGQGQGQGQQTG